MLGVLVKQCFLEGAQNAVRKVLRNEFRKTLANIKANLKNLEEE